MSRLVSSLRSCQHVGKTSPHFSWHTLQVTQLENANLTIPYIGLVRPRFYLNVFSVRKDIYLRIESFGTLGNHD